MNWTPIDPENLPTGKVLAACFKKGSNEYRDKLHGTLKKSFYGSEGVVCFGKRNAALYNCTHYIDINKFDL